jgi:DNA-binding response OmpR family regulator
MSRSAVELLLVEDDSSDAELIQLSLAEEHVDRILHVHDGVEALDFLFCRGAYHERVAEALPKVVLLDLKLPRVDGIEVLRELRENVRTATVPVVMLTSSRLEGDVARAYRCGANSFVQKPVEFEAFRETVRFLARYWLNLNEPPPIRLPGA